MLDNDIASPSPEIACHLTRWKRNRDAVAGQDAIRAAKTAYLPRVYEGQDDREYSTYQSRVVFYPATQRTLENHIGLVFRKDASIVADDSVADILATITPRYGLEDLARELLAETLITNFTGLLVDTPPSKAGLTSLIHDARCRDRSVHLLALAVLRGRPASVAFVSPHSD
ncbi:hypothetical protein [Sphingobium yanoikuyae]|uniref:hypothetical protein n=1 Tax=Sphingobium yanoikuyae TaxID=13690 RepID=UPI0019175BE9|nr:hypothetical protein [Sphingobium yanoikuyae]